MAKQGLLLINLGTPEAPTTEAVRRYLREFLSDPRVIDIHPLGRWLLLNLIILPFRPSKSAAAYRKVWGADGSPLLSHSRALCEQVRAALPELRQNEALLICLPTDLLLLFLPVRWAAAYARLRLVGLLAGAVAVTAGLLIQPLWPLLLFCALPLVGISRLRVGVKS